MPTIDKYKGPLLRTLRLAAEQMLLAVEDRPWLVGLEVEELSIEMKLRFKGDKGTIHCNPNLAFDTDEELQEYSKLTDRELRVSVPIPSPI